MKTKYKVLLFIILFIATISFIPNKISAVIGVDNYRGTHFSPPSNPSGAPHYPYFPYVLSEGTENGNRRMYFCAQKGGALRYFKLPEYKYIITDPAEVADVYEKIEEDYGTDKPYEFVVDDNASYAADYEFGQNFYEKIERAIDEKQGQAMSGILAVVDAEVSELEQAYANGGDYDGELGTLPDGFYYNEDVATGVKESLEAAPENTNMPVAGVSSYVRSLTYTGKEVGETPRYYYIDDITRHIDKNKRVSYIISSGIDVQSTTNAAGKPNNYQKTLSDQNAGDIWEMQRALWQDQADLHPHAGGWYHNIGKEPSGRSVSATAIALYDEAVDYENFHKDYIEVEGGYKAEFAPVINAEIYVDGNTKKYTVGPFTLKYPDDPRFSFVDDMVLVNAETNAETRDFKIIKADSERAYPGNGEEFYVEFDAAKLSNPRKIDIKVKFKYLDETFSNYSRITGTGRKFTYYGFLDVAVRDYITTIESNLSNWNNHDISELHQDDSKYIGEQKGEATTSVETATASDPQNKYIYSVVTNEDGEKLLKQDFYDKKSTPHTDYYHDYDVYTLDWNEVEIDEYNDYPYNRTTKTINNVTHYYIASGWSEIYYSEYINDPRPTRSQQVVNSWGYTETKYYRQYSTYVRTTSTYSGSGSSYSSGDYYYIVNNWQNDYNTYKYDVTTKYFGTNRYQGVFRWKAGLKFDNNGNAYYKVQAYTVYDVDHGNIAVRIEDHDVTEQTGADRVWKEKEIKLTDSGNPIDLRTKIAGKVWEEKRDNVKTSIFTGEIGNGSYIKGIKVYLFQEGKSGAIRVTTTDSNGYYEFNDLDIFTADPQNTPNVNTRYKLSKYSVAFEYNGQYYEASKYTKPANTVDNFKKSNGTEFQDSSTVFGTGFLGRKQLNARFTTIGSSTSNYGTNLQTFTREQLRTAGAIDAYGNPTGGGPEIMKRFVADCMIKSFTKNEQDKIDLYPVSNKIFILKSISQTRPTTKVYNADSSSFGTYAQIKTLRITLDDKSQHINQALKKRIETDLSIFSDVNKVEMEINGNKKTYNYGQLVAYKCSGCGKTGKYGANGQFVYDASVNGGAGGYKCASCNTANPTRLDATVEANITDYVAKLYVEDYAFKSANFEGYTEADELNVFVTYKLNVVNEATTDVKFDEIVVFYDNDFDSIVANRSYVENESGTKLAGFSFGNLSRYDASTIASISGYKNVYIRNNNNTYLKPGEQASIYITFKVGKDSNGRIKLDENVATGVDTGAKEVICEINGYTTKYSDGTTIVNVGPVGGQGSGIIDKDSTPGNFNGTNFEDDTYKAPKLKIKLRRDPDLRLMSGYVWEDSRTKTVGNAIIGDGIRNPNESYIKNVTVKLHELKNGQDYVRGTIVTGSNGQATTELIIKDNISNLIKTQTVDGNYGFKAFIPGVYYLEFIYGNNDTTYNGQDYKSTLYQIGLGTTYGNGTGHVDNTYNKEIADANPNNYSDAQDIWLRRGIVNNYSKDMTYIKAQELWDKSSQNYKNNTYMTAETGKMILGIEYNNAGETSGTENQGAYHLKNVDFGITERPKAQIEILKNVASINITLANGTVLFDSVQSVNNLVWSKNNYSADGNVYNGKLLRDNNTIKNGRKIDGFVNPIMDKEIMHGATITITYDIKVRNIGELDYSDISYYYTGNGGSTVVKTLPRVLVDYVPNNLKFDKDKNASWQVITTEQLKASVKSSLESELNKFNTKIITNLNTPLSPKVNGGTYEVSTKLVLNQTLSTAGTDNFSYTNKVEVISVGNDVGRRMAYSIVGNFNPSENPQELDENKYDVRITQPTGRTTTFIVISLVAILGATIIIVGGVFIKKKILNK